MSLIKRISEYQCIVVKYSGIIAGYFATHNHAHTFQFHSQKYVDDDDEPTEINENH